VTFDPQVRNAAVARSVTAGSPADLAGIKAGDTIVSVNGRRIASYDDVLRWVDRLKPGDVLDIDVSRRVSVRARAVLDGQPVDGTTSNYRPAIESLPVPAGYQSQPPVRRVPTNANSLRPRVNYGAPQGGNNNVNRSNNSNDRDRGFPGRERAPRRRG
jgi:membrane-associated protease RseP (regulator of RpoE activity)